MYAQPVVLIYGCQNRLVFLIKSRRAVIKIITCNIKLTGHPLGIFRTYLTHPGCKNAVDQFFILNSGIARFKIIVYHIVQTAFSCVSTIDRAPVVNHIIAEIYSFVQRPAGLPATVETGSTAGVMSYQIVMKTRWLSSPNTSVTMFSFFVYGTGQAFTDDTPLHGEILIIVKRGTFVCTPTHGAMINNNIFLAHGTHSVVLCAPLVSHS